MATPLATARADLYARLKSHSAGAAVRAATGPGSEAGIIPAHLLRKPLPARLFLCARAGVIAGREGDMREVVLTWWIYDDIAQGYARIDAMVDLVRAAYPLDAIALGETKVTGVGQHGEDSTLGGLLLCPVQVSYRRL